MIQDDVHAKKNSSKYTKIRICWYVSTSGATPKYLNRIFFSAKKLLNTDHPKEAKTFFLVIHSHPFALLTPPPPKIFKQNFSVLFLGHSFDLYGERMHDGRYDRLIKNERIKRF